MAGLADLLEAYRNYRGVQNWRLGRQMDQMHPQAEQAMELWGGVGPSDMGGLAGIFAGVKSNKADLAALTKAKQLTKQGIDKEQIWQETGWFQAPWDKQWRYEISDQPMKAREQTGWMQKYDIGPGIQQTDVYSAYEHPELYKAYPEIADLELYTDPSLQSAATYIPDLLGQTEAVALKLDRPGEIARTRRYLAEMREPAHSNYWRKQLEEEGLGQDREAIKEQLRYMQGMKKGLAELQAGKIWPEVNEPKVRSSLLHELQHAIQDREGFARGGSVEEFIGKINPETGLEYTPEEAKRMYKLMGGEIEARMTQKRMDYSPLYRKFVFPLKSIEEEYPIESIYDPKGISSLMTK